MKVVYTAAALADLDDILKFTAANYPASYSAVERRIRATVERAGRWPEAARRIEERSGVRAALVLRYPFRIFYEIKGGTVEILHIHHTARDYPSI